MEYNNFDMIKYLIEHGANPTINNNYVIRRALKNGNEIIVKYLIDNGFDAKHKYAIQYCLLCTFKKILRVFT